jgi:hypothetical protein
MRDYDAIGDLKVSAPTPKDVILRASQPPCEFAPGAALHDCDPVRVCRLRSRECVARPAPVAADRGVGRFSRPAGRLHPSQIFIRTGFKDLRPGDLNGASFLQAWKASDFMK